MNDLSRPAAPAMHQQPIPRPYAWRRDDVSESDWRVPVPERAVAEIDEVIAILRANPMDIRALCLDDYPLDACRALMKEVRNRLDEGVGMAVLDRLPVERHDKESLTAIYWMLSSMISRPVAQSYDGRLLYDVRDTGRKPTPGCGPTSPTRKSPGTAITASTIRPRTWACWCCEPRARAASARPHP